MKAQPLSITGLVSQRQTGGARSCCQWQFVSKLVSDGCTSQMVASPILCLLSNRTEHKGTAHIASLLRKRTVSWESDHLSCRPSINVVGTGKSRTKSFNLSTATSFLLAAKGWTALKHGGTRISSSCGATDILRKICLSLTPNQTEGTVLPAEIATGWVTTDPSFRFLRVVNPIRKKAPQSYFLNLVLATLNLPNAGCCLIGSSSCQVVRLVLLIAGIAGTKNLGCVSDLSGTDKPTSISPALLIALETNQLTKRLLSFEKAGSEVEMTRIPKATGSWQFLQSFLGVAVGQKVLTPLILALGVSVTSLVWDVGTTLLGSAGEALTILAVGEAFHRISNFARTNDKGI